MVLLRFVKSGTVEYAYKSGNLFFKAELLKELFKVATV